MQLQTNRSAAPKKGATRPRFTAPATPSPDCSKLEEAESKIKMEPAEFVICIPRSLTNNGHPGHPVPEADDSISSAGPLETRNKCNGTIGLP